jgi:antitoxin CcdA
MSGAVLKSAAKKATNITLSQEVLEEAKALGMNLSRTCEQLLRSAIRAEKDRRWALEHAAYIAAYNATLEIEGLPLAQWRTF